MIQQLENLVANNQLRFTLVKWLTARVPPGSPFEAAFHEALQTFVETSGQAVRIVGVLVRDTVPADTDLKARGKALAALLPAECSAELIALHLPMPMAAWPTLVAA
jgi:hypothetical protein